MLHRSLGLKMVFVGAAALLLAACANTQKSKEPVVHETPAPVEQVTPAPLPAGPTPGSQEDLNQSVGDRVFFAFDRSDISADAQSVLRSQADWLRKYPSVNVIVEGHCDERGTREYNLALGERRANAVKNYLTALGIDGSRIETVSYGKERPAVIGNTEEAFAKNRRGVMVVR